jgi:ferric-dicitrate binding protein FerR (iron transport regulator)
MTPIDDRDDMGPDMLANPDLELITDYLAKELPEGQVAEVRRRLETDSAFKDFAAPLIAAWNIPPHWERHPMPRAELEKHWEAFTKRAGFVDQRRAARKRMLGGLTMLLAILGLSAFVLRDEIHERYVDRRDYDVVARGPGSVVLHDGTHASVAAGSVLREAKHQPVAGVELVKVQGNARFDVTRLPSTAVKPAMRALIVGAAGGQISTNSADFSVRARGDTAEVEVFQRPSGARQDMFSVIPDFVSLKGAGQALPQLALREGERGRIVRGKDPVKLDSVIASPTATSAESRPSSPTADKMTIASAVKTASVTSAKDAAHWMDLANGIRAQVAPNASLRVRGFSHDSLLQFLTLTGQARFILPQMKIDLTGLAPPKGIAVSTPGTDVICNGGDFTVTALGDTTEIVVAERHMAVNLAIAVPMREYVLVFLAKGSAPKRVMSGESARIVRGGPLVTRPTENTPAKTQEPRP